MNKTIIHLEREVHLLKERNTILLERNVGEHSECISKRVHESIVQHLHTMFDELRRKYRESKGEGERLGMFVNEETRLENLNEKQSQQLERNRRLSKVMEKDGRQYKSGVEHGQRMAILVEEEMMGSEKLEKDEPFQIVKRDERLLRMCEKNGEQPKIMEREQKQFKMADRNERKPTALEEHQRESKTLDKDERVTKVRVWEEKPSKTAEKNIRLCKVFDKKTEEKWLGKLHQKKHEEKSERPMRQDKSRKDDWTQQEKSGKESQNHEGIKQDLPIQQKKPQVQEQALQWIHPLVMQHEQRNPTQYHDSKQILDNLKEKGQQREQFQQAAPEEHRHFQETKVTQKDISIRSHQEREKTELNQQTVRQNEFNERHNIRMENRQKQSEDTTKENSTKSKEEQTKSKETLRNQQE